MEKTHIILYTVLIIIICNFFGFVFSIASIHFKFLEKYKIQKRKIKPVTFYKRLPLILFNISLLIITSCIGLYFFLDIINYETLIKNPLNIFLQLVVILIIDDVYFLFHSYVYA